MEPDLIRFIIAVALLGGLDWLSGLLYREDDDL